MDTIRQIGISICITAVATAIFQAVLPHSNLNKTIRFVLGTFMISCLIQPFLSFNFDDLNIAANNPAEYQSDVTAYQDIVNQKLSDLTATSVAATVKSLLREKGIEAENVAVETNIGDNNSIIISSITITVRPDDTKEANDVAKTFVTGSDTVIEIIGS